MAIQKEDQSHLRVTLRSVRDNANWTEGQLLDLQTHNYEDWKNRIIDRLDASSGLSAYLFDAPRLHLPLTPYEPAATSNDEMNDLSVLGYIRSHMCKAERDYINACKFAHQAWSALETHHLR
ncbi:hypothetical protein FISHEDRAFT_61304 [Fistulina hepatica ATCC 64428]|uniref:Uncharacterized protein n=1 Tax=Fistulina hepatica ATCC 64428 TaxID=1128425 RepID=A0A0D7A3E3_9AGAR|nr:hypothetical protein FISHEDRAFT_61304 [Fistulina hepatica ATCC 64428]